jgi:hypothetical protein
MLVLSRGQAADGRRVTPLPSLVQGAAPCPHPFAFRYSFPAPHLAPEPFFLPRPLRAFLARVNAVRGDYGNLGVPRGPSLTSLAEYGPFGFWRSEPPALLGLGSRSGSCVSDRRPDSSPHRGGTASRVSRSTCMEVERQTACPSMPPHSPAPAEWSRVAVLGSCSRGPRWRQNASAWGNLPRRESGGGTARIRSSRVCLLTPESPSVSVPLYLR